MRKRWSASTKMRRGRVNTPDRSSARPFEEVTTLFQDDRRANNRRMSTLEEYQTELKLRLLPQPNDRLPPLGPRDIRNIKRADMKAHFNVSRVIGHARSTIVDTIYAHTVDSALAGVSERVAERIGLTPPATPKPPTAPRQPPKLRVVGGARGARRGTINPPAPVDGSVTY